MKKGTKRMVGILLLVCSIWIFVFLVFYKWFSQETGNRNVTTQINTETEEVMIEETEDTKEDIQEEMEEQSTLEENEATTIVFAGDVLIAEAANQYYDAEGITGLVSEELLAEMKHADICMVNQEFQFSNRGTPMEDKQYTFRTDPKYVQILKDLGVDIVSLANNHTIDFGLEALQDTFTTLDNAGILYAGAGETKERAEALQIIEVNGRKIGFLSATRVIPVAEWNVELREPGLFATYDDTRLIACIKEAKEVCDFLTVYVHWGMEREAFPQEYQTVIAKHCMEAGADVIIGAHPHVLQGIEWIEEKPVFYSLGNYIFNYTIEQTMLVKVELQSDGEVSYQLIPAYAAAGKTKRLEGEQAESLFTYLNEISINATIDQNGIVKR